jgi:transposase InsO family protein
MKAMVTSEDHRHFSLRGVALHAQRIGKLFASPSTWGRIARERGWVRPRVRVHPAAPKEGIRATRPNEYWHLDVTLIRLLDGSRLYLHAVIDNFSRRILAWKLAEALEPKTTCDLLVAAGAGLALPAPAIVVADSGVENVNGQVDALLEGAPSALKRVLAQVDVSFSNSLIEAWWRSLKHGWLFLNTLDSFAAVERLVASYVDQHNRVMPHAAFHGQTPDEIYFGKGDGVPGELVAARRVAREARLAANRNLQCGSCAPTGDHGAPSDVAGGGESALSPGVLQLHASSSGMS